MGQRRGGCGGEEAAAAVAVDVAAGEGAREAGGAERYARAEEEVAKRRRRQPRRHRFDSTARLEQQHQHGVAADGGAEIIGGLSFARWITTYISTKNQLIIYLIFY